MSISQAHRSSMSGARTLDDVNPSDKASPCLAKSFEGPSPIRGNHRPSMAQPSGAGLAWCPGLAGSASDSAGSRSESRRHSPAWTRATRGTSKPGLAPRHEVVQATGRRRSLCANAVSRRRVVLVPLAVPLPTATSASSPSVRKGSTPTWPSTASGPSSASNDSYMSLRWCSSEH
jgi:hypothetical protein